MTDKSRIFYLYLLECSNGHIYTGQTTDFQRRWLQHQQGYPGCKYTRSFPPKKILLCVSFDCTLSDILKIEHAIKKLGKTKKLMLLQTPAMLNQLIQSMGLNLEPKGFNCDSFA